MKRDALWAASLLALLILPVRPASAASTVVTHNTDVTTNTAAVCVAVPERETGAIVVGRIRITGSRTTPTSYTFVHKRTRDSVGDTEDVSGSNCTLSGGCAVVVGLEGVIAGKVLDADDLDFVLPPGHRLYFYTDSDIGSDHQSVEIYYQQR